MRFQPFSVFNFAISLPQSPHFTDQTSRSSVDLSPQLSLYSNITAFRHYSSKWNSCRGIMGQRYQIRSTNIISDYTAANGGRRFTMFPVMPPVCALNRNAQAPDTAPCTSRYSSRTSRIGLVHERVSNSSRLSPDRDRWKSSLENRANGRSSCAH